MHRSLIIVSVLALSTHVAHADPREHFGRLALEYTGDVAAMRAGDKPYGGRSIADCRELIKGLEDAGVKDDEKLYGGYYGKPYDGVGFDSDAGRSFITFGVARKMCEEMATLLPAFDAVPELTKDVTELTRRADLTVDQIDDQLVESDGEDMIALGQTCAKRVEDVLGAGAVRDLPLPLGEAKLTLDEVTPKVCQPLIDWGTKWAPELHAAAKRKQAELEAPYRKAGIKGDRLALFVSEGAPEDGSFYLPGCDRFATDASTLKKAKKLFIWLTDDYGEVTLRKYTFKGDKYSVQERTFDLKESAYRWCH